MNPIRLLGFVLLWAGFFAAAFCAVLRPELKDHKWMTVPWFWFVASMAVGLVGVVLLWQTRKAGHQQSERVDAQLDKLVASLNSLVARVRELGQKQKQLSPPQIVQFIDRHCAESFSDFADNRRSLIHRFGLQSYAEVMTQFASAERYTNRAWSAAADGYVDEVADSLQRAQAYLDNAHLLLVELGAIKK